VLWAQNEKPKTVAMNSVKACAKEILRGMDRINLGAEMDLELDGSGELGGMIWSGADRSAASMFSDLLGRFGLNVGEFRAELLRLHSVWELHCDPRTGPSIWWELAGELERLGLWVEPAAPLVEVVSAPPPALPTPGPQYGSQTVRDFKKLERQWSRWILRMVNRFSVDNGDAPDLYNDGLLILWQTAQEFDPSTPDFHKMLKTRIGHLFTDHVRHHLARKRSVKVTGRLFHSSEGKGLDFVGDPNNGLDSSVADVWSRMFSDDVETSDYVGKFFASLTDRERTLLGQLLEPADALVDLFQGTAYRRRPAEIPLKLIAQYLEWTMREAKLTANAIRRKYSEFSGDDSLLALIPKV
jgi:DNA-directed RNA polymerase specialized sigma24 family protein